MHFQDLSLVDRKIIVGIDFGTTFSGIAWAETRRPDRRMANTSWPISQSIREGESSEKVPSRLRYTQDGIQWGFTIPITAPESEVVEWFKLDLDPSVGGIRTGASRLPLAREEKRDAEKLATDYLSALIDHLVYILRQKLGDSVLKGTPLEIVLTVPAIWSEDARDRTKKSCQRAIQNADIQGPIHLVSEPEAAAIFSLHGLDPHGLVAGDTIVVVDAGGGTVDLITYRVIDLDPILQVEEAAPGSGALCGSTFLNQGFASFIRAKLGRLKSFDDEVMAEAMEAFEKKVKRRFMIADLPDGVFNIPVGGLANNKALGISRGRWTIRAKDVESIFEPVVSQVIDLVKEQISQSPSSVKAVLMVGGFGASNYLKDRLRDAMGGLIPVMQPPQAWQAVVQGAVMKGLASCAPDQLTVVSVRGRRARKHYGTELNVKYENNTHSEKRGAKYWDGYYGHDRINIMKWFLKRGDEVVENQPIIERFHQRILVSGGSLAKVSLTIYADTASQNAPLFRDHNVRHLATLKVDVASIPLHEVSRQRGRDGLMYYTFDFEIELVYLSASTKYTLIYGNERHDTVTCEYV